MSACDPGNHRRRRGSAAAAVCGGAAASSVALGHHAASHGAQSVAWDDVGMAVAIVLIVAALAICIVTVRRGR